MSLPDGWFEYKTDTGEVSNVIAYVFMRPLNAEIILPVTLLCKKYSA